MDICEHKRRLGRSTRHPWEIARAQFISDLVGFYFFRENRPLRLLDFGCGDGFVTSIVAGRYAMYHFVCVDSKIHELNKQGGAGRDNEQIRYFESLEEFCGEEGSLDGGLLLDVLEHIADDDLFLPWFFGHKAFSNNSRFVITCPAFRFLFSQHDSMLGHFRRYSLSELKGKVEQAGCVPIESGHIFFIPLALRLVEVLLEKVKLLNRRERTLISTWRGGNFVTLLLSRILYVDVILCRFLKRFSVGLTCYIVCTRRA